MVKVDNMCLLTLCYLPQTSTTHLIEPTCSFPARGACGLLWNPSFRKKPDTAVINTAVLTKYLSRTTARDLLFEQRSPLRHSHIFTTFKFFQTQWNRHTVAMAQPDWFWTKLNAHYYSIMSIMETTPSTCWKDTRNYNSGKKFTLHLL